MYEFKPVFELKYENCIVVRPDEADFMSHTMGQLWVMKFTTMCKRF